MKRDPVFPDGHPLKREPLNPEAHRLLTDQGAAVLVYQGEADFDDGDAENGPETWGCPEYDHYQSESHDVWIEWEGMVISELEPDPPAGWF
jgi:hypothetical protein